MKFLLEKYRIITITLSLLIVSLGFVAASDKEKRIVCTLLAFGLGILLYVAGSIREWSRKRLPACLIEAILAVCMLSAVLLLLSYLGGIV